MWAGTGRSSLTSAPTAAVVFYQTILGFQVRQRMGGAFALVSKGDLVLWLSGPKSSAARSMPDGQRPQPGGWNRIVIEVEELPGRVEDLRRPGARVRNDIVEGPGGKQILLQDPADNLVELFEPG